MASVPATPRLPALAASILFGGSGGGSARGGALQTSRARGGMISFVVEGQTFELPRTLLAVHSPGWADRMAKDPTLREVSLPEASAASFGAFEKFLRGVDGVEGDVTARNVKDVLYWGEELGIDHLPAQCESFLLTCNERTFTPQQFLELSARHNMPLLYARALELAAQWSIDLDVPDVFSDAGAQLPAVFASEQIRNDLISAHISMGLMRGDGEMRRRHCFADHTTLEDPQQRARLMWKSRKRFVKAPAEPPGHNWRALQTVLPHHSLKGPDWVVAASETQPTGLRPPGHGALGRSRRGMSSGRSANQLTR
mmetsp:Transcript_14957/g.41787  ORF Transcript_14957/g.41787 Transcript_14957/m.41787 type:complete len:312 (+) Transcript_14957:75-1010(+)